MSAAASLLYDAPGPKTRRLSRVTSVLVAVGIAAVVGWLVYSLGAPRVTAQGVTLPGLWDGRRWEIFTESEVWYGLLWRGLVMGTLRVAAVAAVLAVLIGILFSFGRTAQSAWIRIPVTIVLEFFRGMPILLMMLFILLALATSGYWAAVWALAVYNGALIGEALRAGIVSLPRGQREAGLSLGLSSVKTRLLIEFPQAFRQMLPVILAQLVVLLKDTSLAYIVAYPELTRVSNQLKDYYGSTRYSFSIFLVMLAIYLAVNLLFSAVARYVAKRTESGTTSRRRRHASRIELADDAGA